MTWQGIQGHDDVVERFRHALSAGKLASTFLFVGPEGIGKRTLALKLAQSMLCEERDEVALAPCGTCPACRQVATLTHPDLYLVSKPADKSYIPVEKFIGDREHRMREGLCHDIAMKPFRGGRKIAVIDDADYMNAEGANCLLKTLEEPPPRSVIILIGTSAQKQLPTIRSRSQLVRFQPLPDDVMASVLLEQGLVNEAAEASSLAALANGSLARAQELVTPELREFRQLLFEQLSGIDVQRGGFVKTLSRFIEQAGKDAPARRGRTQQVVRFAADFYRQLMRRLSGLPVIGDEILIRQVEEAVGQWRSDAEQASDCLDRCLDAEWQIQANANQATLLEAWTDDLTQISLGRRVTS